VDYYRADLAFIHDAGYGAIARGAAERLLSELQRRGINQGTVVDLGCGSGILAEAVSAAGYDVLGIDISAAMIEIARGRVPKARFLCASLLAAEIPPCVGVTATGEAVNYLFDTTNTGAALADLFQRANNALMPGGLFLFDAAEPARRYASPPQRFTLTPDWATLVEVNNDPDPTVLARQITTFRKDGETYRRQEEFHRQRLYTRSQLAGSLRGAGFRVHFLKGYGERPFPTGIFGVLAWKA
jgi:SAM-dependent methyltransferase